MKLLTQCATQCVLALSLLSFIPATLAQEAATPATPAPTALDTAPTPSTISAADKTFLEQAAAAGLAEKLASEVISDITTTPHVDGYANWIIRAHSKMNSQLQLLAHLKGVALMPDLSKDDATAIQTLVGRSGTDADAFYGQTFGIQVNEKAIKLFAAEIQNGQDNQVQSFATRMLPVLRTHLKAAQRVFGADQ